MKSPNQKAFTLIELLVVISIIAILAGIALPAFTAVQTKGAQTKALSNAKQIGMACKLFAGDYNGNFPLYTNVGTKTLATKGSPSNDVLQTLMPDYLPDKSIFAIAKSAFCKSAGTASTGANAMLLGTLENEWAYVLGLTDTSNSQWPLIASGFASPANGTYADDETQQGGIWRNKAAVVIRCDISGKVEKLVGTSQKVVPRSESDPSNAFVYQAASGNVPAWLGLGTSVLNPN